MTSPLKEQFDAVLSFAAPLEAANKRKERRSKSKNAEKDDKPEDGADFLHQVLVQATKTPEFSEKIVEAVDLRFDQSAIITPRSGTRPPSRPTRSACFGAAERLRLR